MKRGRHGMLRLLASLLLKKTIPAARKAARQRGNVNLIGEPKKETASPEKSCLPMAATLPSTISEDFDTSPRAGGSDHQRAYPSPTGVAKSKHYCQSSNAAAAA
jgi:hypothetical protein